MRWVNQNINGSRYIGFHRKGSNRLLGIKITKTNDDFSKELDEVFNKVTDEFIQQWIDEESIQIPESVVAVSDIQYFEESSLSKISAPKLKHMDLV